MSSSSSHSSSESSRKAIFLERLDEDDIISFLSHTESVSKKMSCLRKQGVLLHIYYFVQANYTNFKQKHTESVMPRLSKQGFFCTHTHRQKGV